jgi:hypothetical protein
LSYSSITKLSKCFKCNVPIYFTSKDRETPSGRPTRDPLTGKVMPLDPATQEYHLCKPIDIETFRETEEYKQKIMQWKAKQQNNQNNGDTSTTKGTEGTSSTYETRDITNQILEQVLSDIDQIKMDIISIKDALKSGASGSGEAKS